MGRAPCLWQWQGTNGMGPGPRVARDESSVARDQRAGPRVARDEWTGPEAATGRGAGRPATGRWAAGGSGLARAVSRTAVPNGRVAEWRIARHKDRLGWGLAKAFGLGNASDVVQHKVRTS